MAMPGYYAQAGQLGGQNSATNAPEAPRTIASAIGRIDSLNERLVKAREQLTILSDQIGGPRPTAGERTGGSPVAPMGAVARLNEATETAHSQMNDIDELLGSIGRALG